MKAVILAGGLGTRITEETSIRPKPMIEIGGNPVLWHIMKLYSYHGINEFIICLGYKGYMIKEYFANYYLHMSDVTFDMSDNSMEVHQNKVEPWRVTLVDTGENTMTGGRLKRVRSYLGDEDFCFTYDDGISDVDIGSLIDFHRKMNGIATLTAVLPPGRFGALDLEKQKIVSFQEKPQGDGAESTGGILFFRQRLLIISMVTKLYGNAARWRALLRKASCLLIFMMVSGNRWIPYGTSSCWSHSGHRGRPPGKSGSESGLLES